MSNAIDSTKTTCFFVTRIGEPGTSERARVDDVTKYIVRPVLDEFDVRLNRVDLDPTPGQVTAQIIRGLIESDLVLADVTGRNPNVFYELAVAHAFRRPVITLIDEPGSLPFDAHNEKVISVGDKDGERISAANAERAKKDLRAALEVVLEPSYTPENVVTAAAGAQSLDALAPGDPMAFEIASIRETVEALAMQSRSSGKVTSDPRIRELRALTRLIEYLANEGGYITDYELRTNGITEATSDAYDRWIRNQGETMRRNRRRWAIRDLWEEDAVTESYEDGDPPYVPDKWVKRQMMSGTSDHVTETSSDTKAGDS